MKKQGFTLIECLVAISLLTLLVLLATQFALRSYAPLHILRTQSNRCMMLHTAFDMVLHDIKRAPEMKKWTTISKNEYAWKCGNDTIRWYLDGDTLMRSAHKKANLVATEVSDFTIKEINTGFVVSLSGKGEGNSNNIEQPVRVIR